MKQKLFLCGNGPLPIEPGIVSQTAFGLRTWQFLSAVGQFDGAVLVVLLADPKHYSQSPTFGETETMEVFGKQIQVLRLQQNSADFSMKLKRAWKDFQPTVSAGINLMSAFSISKLKPKIPFWADLNGWSLAEAQSQAFIEGDDAYIPVIWQREKVILKSADRFSTVSEPQLQALYGQLGTVGRLNHKTENERLGVSIPNGNELDQITPKKSSSTSSEQSAEKMKFNLRKKLKLPTDSFLVFFSGAYNTWLDEALLFSGLEQAMKKNPRIFFVSTGGAASVSNKVLKSFQSRIKNSNLTDRFHFLGWIEKSELLDCYAQVDLAVNIDRDNVETKFGARNRINEWLAYEVPVCSTVGTEVTCELSAENCLLPVELGNAKSLVDQILNASDGFDLRGMAQRARVFAETNYSYEQTTAKFRDWLSSPKKSADFSYNLSMRPSLLRRIWFKAKQRFL